jgi:hypothetical protein
MRKLDLIIRILRNVASFLRTIEAAWSAASFLYALLSGFVAVPSWGSFSRAGNDLWTFVKTSRINRINRIVC